MTSRANTEAAKTTAQTFTPLGNRILQRKCACGGSPGLSGECAGCHGKKPKREALNSQFEAEHLHAVPSIVHEVLRSPGQPLDMDTRAFMESRFAHNFGGVRVFHNAWHAPQGRMTVGPAHDEFEQETKRVSHGLTTSRKNLQSDGRRPGYDFSRVRVHTDKQAAESAKAINALAYTVGDHMVFGPGQYAPDTLEGKRLLAHELTHAIQQRAGPTGPAAMILGMSRSDDIAEHEASAVEDAITHDAPVPPLRLRAGHIARQEAATPLVPSTPPTAAASGAIRTVKVWLNAFIPRDIAGLTKPAPGHPGETMIPGPGGWSDCFMTDQRDFDSNIHASSRMHSEIEVDLAGPSENFQWHNCDPTREIDCEDGDEECSKKGDSSKTKYSKLRGSVVSLIKVDLNAAANNPCYSGSPDIDYLGTVTIDAAVRKVKFGGLIDAFPAFEMYATADGGAGTPLFKEPPPAGNTPADLFGGANRNITGETTI
jgi:Domain of unknown function (DUF4157)/Protein of unknown function (DUF3238)